MTRLLILPAIFVAATLSLWLLISSAPDWQAGRPAHSPDAGGHPESAATTAPRLELPTQFENFTAVAEQFRTYKEDHYVYITSLFICVYLYKQTFAIPGSFLLNIIAGAVFGMWTGFAMVCVLTTCGSSLCYLFSELFSREYVLYYFGERLTYLQQKVDDNSHRLLPFLLFARMFPISPSWLLNIVAPFLNIPLPIFAFSAFIDPYDRLFMGQLCGREGKPLQKLVVVKPTGNGGTANGELEKTAPSKEVQFAKPNKDAESVRGSLTPTPREPGAGEAQDDDTESHTVSAARICLLGNRESGKSTILEQIRKMSKVPPSDFEFQLRKSFIFNNCVNSMRKILEYMRNTNTPLRREENKDYSELILENERTHGNPLSELECRALASLWRDETIQELYVRRAEYCLNDSTKYFMENLNRIKSPDYRPIHDDLLMAYIPTVGVQNMIFTVNDCMFQLFEIGGSKILDRKWSNLFEGLDAIFFTLAISVYDHMLANGQFEFVYSMGVLEQLCKEERFNDVPLYIFLNECDVFKEKLQRVKLADYFPDYKGHSQKDAFRYMREHVAKRCALHRRNMSNVYFHFSCAIDTKQMHSLLSTLFTEIIQRKKRGE